MPSANAYFKNVSIYFLSVVSLYLVKQDCNATEPPWIGVRVGSVVSVTLSNGRVVRGCIDASTTNDHLHLALEEPGIKVSTVLSSGEVKRLQLEVTQPQDAKSQGNNRVAVLAPGPRQVFENSRNRNSTLATSLAVFAHVDNWNGDPKSDGIRLFLRPTDANGEMVQTTGTVSIQLFVYRGDIRNTTGRLHEEESWSYELTESDYHRSGATITLPFRKIQPDNEHEVYSLGTLNVRLKNAGQGVLDATLDDVVLRKNSITSDLRKRH